MTRRQLLHFYSFSSHTLVSAEASRIRWDSTQRLNDILTDKTLCHPLWNNRNLWIPEKSDIFPSKYELIKMSACMVKGKKFRSWENLIKISENYYKISHWRALLDHMAYNLYESTGKTKNGRRSNQNKLFSWAIVKS